MKKRIKIHKFFTYFFFNTNTINLQAKPPSPVLSPVTPVPRSNNPSPNFAIPEPSLGGAGKPSPLDARNIENTAKRVENEINNSSGGKLLKSRGSILNNNNANELDNSGRLLKKRNSSLNSSSNGQGKLLKSRGTIDDEGDGVLNNNNNDEASKNIKNNSKKNRSSLRDTKTMNNDTIGEEESSPTDPMTPIKDVVKSERRKKSRKKSKKKQPLAGDGGGEGGGMPSSLPPLRGGGGKLPPLALSSGMGVSTDSTI